MTKQLSIFQTLSLRSDNQPRDVAKLDGGNFSSTPLILGTLVPRTSDKPYRNINGELLPF